ncbi:MAG TPA: hypothetical protein VKC63_12640 [Solirubrobacterales bacterium]|nr:hypothetical protein [Solirubrobacterales bacterium]
MFGKRAHRHARIGLVCVVAIALPVAGCGKSESTASSGSEKAAFIERANAICEARSADIQANAHPYLQAKKMSLYIKAIKIIRHAVAPGLEREVLDIRALEMPEEDKGRIEAILTATEASVDRAFSHPTSNANPYAKSEALAAKYGLHACGAP